MKLHISSKEIQFWNKLWAFSSLRWMILQVLTLGLCSTLLFSAKVMQDFRLPAGLEAGAKEQLLIFKQICRLVREAGKEVSPRHMPDKLKLELISLLQQAAGFSQEKTQLEYLHKLAKNFRNNEFFSPFFIYSRQHKVYPDIIFISSPDDKKLNVYVLLTKPDATRLAVDSLRVGVKMAEDYPLNTKLSGLFFPKNPLIRVCNVYCSSQVDQMVLHIPPNSDNLPNNQFLLILLEDVIHRYFATHIQPLGRSILDVQGMIKIDALTYYTALLLHRISHYYGPVEVVIQKIQEPVNERLKDLFYVFEEIRADSAFLANLSLWKNLKLSVNKEVMFPTFLVTLIDRLMPGSKQKSTLPYLVEFNYLLEQGGWSYDINKRSFSVNVKKFAQGIKMLLVQSLDMLQRGNYQEAENFIKRYAKIPKELKEVISRYKKSNPQPAAAKSE